MSQKKRCSGEEAWSRRLDRFVPILVRLLARDPRGRPLTTAEIAERSGLFPMEIETLSRATSWDGVTIPTYRSFCRACNLDLMNSQQAKRNEVYLNGKLVNGVRQPCLWLFLKRDPAWETYYRPLMLLYIEFITKKLKTP
jgi:hypothetical protein